MLIESRFPGAANESDLSQCFPDVNDGWFAPYVCYGLEHGIVGGYPDGTFQPSQNVNLAEALKIVLETYDIEVDLSDGETWYDPYYNLVSENDWLEDIDESVAHYVTRGEMMKLAYVATMVNENTDQVAFADHLESCAEYQDTFIHLLMAEDMNREILGFVDGTCHYFEQMPNDGEMNCEYDEDLRITVAQYYKDLAEADTYSVSFSINSEGATSTYTIDGVEVENPLQEALDSEACVVSGY